MKQVDNYKSGQIGRHYIAAEPLRRGWTVAMPSAFGRRSMAFKHIFALPQLGFALFLMVKPVVGSEAVFTLTVSNAASVSDDRGADMSVAGNTVLPILIPASLTARTEAKRPDRLLSEATTKIIELLKNNRDLYAKDHDKLYAMAYEHIVSLFDFRIIAKLILNEHWRQASEGQRTQFATEFRDRLVRTYATALLKYQDEQFVFLPFNAKPEDKRVIVKTEFKRGDGGPNIAVNYRLYNGKSGWKVYDVMVMGISLVTMYRNVYAIKIKNEGIDAVINSLAHVDKQVSQ
jgi:phospholipid transport system substrate-binding protein